MAVCCPRDLFVYIGGLAFAARIDFVSENPRLIFGVPSSVLLWGAAGSLAAILYRFYTKYGDIRFATEFRWLIARPFIGIIMGGVVYIALNSGLVLLATGGAGSNATPTTGIHNQAFWIVAFRAGFSDKFYLGVIDLLVERTGSTKQPNTNTVITEIQQSPVPAVGATATGTGTSGGAGTGGAGGNTNGQTRGLEFSLLESSTTAYTSPAPLGNE